MSLVKAHTQPASVALANPREALRLEKSRRKALGAFYTPPEIVAYMCQESLLRYLDTSVNRERKLVPRKTLEALIRLGRAKALAQNARLIDQHLAAVTCCDPAVGAGAFLLGMMQAIVQARCALNPYLPNAQVRTPCYLMRHALQHCLYGVDIDADAVEAARFRLQQPLVAAGAGDRKMSSLPGLRNHIRTGDALLGLKTETTECAKSAHGNFKFEGCFPEVFRKRAGFDLVVANPPYLFLTGKGSPIRQLVRANRLNAAKRLQARCNLYTRRFPASSHGCRDLYKWFIDLAFRIARPGGVVACITPNTFLALKRYADVRQLLFECHATDLVLDLGFDVFESPLVPAAIFIARRAPPEKGPVRYCDLKGIERSSFKEQSLARLVERHQRAVLVQHGELLLFKHPVAERLYRSCSATLRDFAVLSEGEHDMMVAPERISRKPSADSVPAVEDAQLCRFTPLSRVYVPRADCPGFDLALHSGERFFLRKTGDRIVAAPPLNYSLAVAHQNVYVIHPKPARASVHLLLGLLNSSLLTFLYQNGPYGQKGRTLAQFRIYALYLLPFPAIPGPLAKAIECKVACLIQLRKHSPKAETAPLEKQLNQLVCRAYGLTPEEIAAVEGAPARLNRSKRH